MIKDLVPDPVIRDQVAKALLTLRTAGFFGALIADEKANATSRIIASPATAESEAHYLRGQERLYDLLRNITTEAAKGN